LKLKASFAKIVGTPKETRDSWVVVEDDFFLLLGIEGEIIEGGETAIANVGKDLIEEVVSKVNSLETKNLANLKQILEKISPQEDIALSLILGVQKEAVFYLLCRGGGRVALRREGKFGVISEGEGAVSGPIKINDLFILSLPRFNEIVTQEELQAGFGSYAVSEIAEGLSALIHRADDTSGVAALMAEFQEAGDEDLAGEEERAEEKESSTFHLRSLCLRALNKIFLRLQNLAQTFKKSTVIYLRVPQNEEEKKRRVIFWVALILLSLLAISIIFGFHRQGQSRRANQFNQAFDLASHQLEEGKALVGVNNLRAVSLLGEAKDSLEAVKGDFTKNSSEAKRISDLQDQIGKELEAASQIYKEDGELFMDIGLIKEGGEGVGLALSGPNLIIVDKKGSSVYELSTKSKSSEILLGSDDLAGASLLAADESRLYVLAEKGILELKLGASTKELKTVTKKDDDWGQIIDMEFFGGNLYLLDQSKGKVWKYSGANGFSARTNYLIGDYILSHPSSMAVDGSVWLTTNKVLKFTYGKEDTLNLAEVNSGLGTPLSDNLELFTSDDSKNLYVLDKKNKRLVVLEKSGAYLAQYLWDQMEKVDDFVVLGDKEIYLLLGSKIYRIGVK
jgi:hypothetical protein